MSLKSQQGDLFDPPSGFCVSCGAVWEVDDCTDELYMQHTFGCALQEETNATPEPPKRMA